jgi:hypothetical protein
VPASAGLALSPFTPAPDYSNTEPRDRSLWIELAEAVPDNQALFGRILSEAPDPLLHRNASVASLPPPDPPPINLDPEFIRRILPAPTGEDGAGLDSMTRLDDMTVDRRFVRLPVPLQLALDDPRLFGSGATSSALAIRNGRPPRRASAGR